VPQSAQAVEIDTVCRSVGDTELLRALADRRRALLAQNTSFRARSLEPLALHLARPGVLENAGLCLHPLYGFAYLPGQGIKGLARAYATTVWLPSQREPDEGRKQIERVFGFGPDGEAAAPERTPAKDGPQAATGDVDDGAAGSVVFHEAWPLEWPLLERDIVNSHNAKYYKPEVSAKEDGGAIKLNASAQVPPPNDTDAPNLVSFLTVKPGAVFEFFVAGRPASGASTDDLELAVKWLKGGLALLGSGAKTSAGYGHFEICQEEFEARPPSSWKVAEVEIELATPAFLAGARQDEDDCDLRVPTLRGLLRWWWRTMHSGFVTATELRYMEDVLWGAASRTGAVKVRVAPAGNSTEAALFDRKARMEALRIRRPTPTDGGKRTEGLTYATFGMNDGGNNDPKPPRHFKAPAAKWKVTLTARARGKVSAEAALEQARWTLWLLCRYGGVGSKSRHGLGSLVDIDAPTAPGSNQGDELDLLQGACETFRAGLGLAERTFDSNRVKWPSLAYAAENNLLVEQALTGRTGEDLDSALKVVDFVGAAAQEFAAVNKHDKKKFALGTPRKVKYPFTGEWTGWTAPDRYASPVIYHLVKPRAAAGDWTVRISAFPVDWGEGLTLDQHKDYLAGVLQSVTKYLTNPPAPAAGGQNPGQGGYRPGQGGGRQGWGGGGRHGGFGGGHQGGRGQQRAEQPGHRNRRER
jgi:CRISPR-associated protein Cmr6